jgi:hypothetical protein
MEFNQSFIGYSPNQSLKFSGADSQEGLSANLKELEDDWYYRTVDITYNHNSLGHRSIEPNNLNLDNYILFTGCSHTEGIGLELEKTYPYLVADQLECDYYNLALGGSGIDAMMHNLSLWLGKVKEKPKAIVVQWPNEARFLLTDEQSTLVSKLRPMGIWNSEEEISRFMAAGSVNGFFSSRKKIAYKLINSFSDDIKIVNVDIETLADNTMENFLLMSKLDRARDLIHFGIKSNEKLANNLLTLLR